MWKDMRKGEMIFIYIIWLISAIIYVFGTFYMFGIGKEAVDNILPSSVIQTTAPDSALSDVIDGTRRAVLTWTGGDTSKVLLGTLAYVVLATLIYILVGKTKQRVWGIYFFGILFHLVVGIVLIVSLFNFFPASV